MIVSKLKLEFPDARWMIAGGHGESALRVFGRVAGEMKSAGNAALERISMERMSLNELLYHVVMGEGAEA
jgi:hypothetical protein